MDFEEVVVVGAGLAGLTVAYRLKQKGLPVTIFEARNRVGGRVLSVSLKGDIAELGGQNIQDGGEAVHIRKLITEFGLKTKKRVANFHLQYVENGIAYSLIHELKNLGWSNEELKTRLEEAQKNCKNMQEVLEHLFEKNSILLKTCSAILSGYEGASVEKLATSNTDTLYSILCGGLSQVHQGNLEKEATIEFESVDGGNGLLAEKMAESLQGQLHLNHALKAIRKNKEGDYELVFANGKTVEAKKLILAIPCSVMKDIEIAEEVIEKQHLEKILQVQYGENAKVLFSTPHLEYEEAQCTNGKATTFMNNCSHVVNLYLLGEQSHFTEKNVEKRVEENRELLKKSISIRCN